jgi:hypothetical protein
MKGTIAVVDLGRPEHSELRNALSTFFHFHQPGATPFFYNHSAPLHAVPGATVDYESKAYTRANMTRESLLDRIGDAYVRILQYRQ